MRLQAAAFDMDDTLLRDDLTVSASTIETLRQAAAAGIRILPASGRTIGSMLPFIRQMDCVTAFICANGAEVWSGDGRLLRSATIPTPLAQEIVRFAEAKGVYCQGYDENGYYFNQRGEWADAYARGTGLKGRHTDDLAGEMEKPTNKILMMAQPEIISALIKEAGGLFGGRAQITCSKPWFLECNALEATKGNALTWCASHFGFDLACTAAFGDSLNDLSMLETAGMGYAMANAREDVKARIGRLCPSNMEDGVAKTLQKLMAEEQT